MVRTCRVYDPQVDKKTELYKTPQQDMVESSEPINLSRVMPRV